MSPADKGVMSKGLGWSSTLFALLMVAQCVAALLYIVFVVL